MDGLFRAGTREPQVPVLLESRKVRMIRSPLLAPPLNPSLPSPPSPPNPQREGKEWETVTNHTFYITIITI